MMTIKMYFTGLTEEQRADIGKRIKSKYYNLYHINPPKVYEDGIWVNLYDPLWIYNESDAIQKRFKKKYPEAVFKKLRKRIKHG
jgi:hypothetical protein